MCYNIITVKNGTSPNRKEMIFMRNDLRTPVNTAEIVKLHDMLLTLNIPHEFIPHWTGTGFQILYPNSKERICSAVCFNGSYGGQSGLIEIMGLLTEDESECDEVVGFLLATEVFDRIYKHYSLNK